MTERARRRWPLTSATAALAIAALGYVLVAPEAGSVADEARFAQAEAIERQPAEHAVEIALPTEGLDEAPPDDGVGGDGTRHRGEEGKMGKPTAKSVAGLYAMKGPADAAPDETARHAGVLGVEAGPRRVLARSEGGAYAVGDDDADVWGGLEGTEVGETAGVGGLGLVGTGRGGGGVGEGTIGLGGGGKGIGRGSGYGRGPGIGFNNNVQARTLTVGTVDDFSDARAWDEAAKALTPAAQRLGISDEWLGMQGPGQRHVEQPDALDIALVLDTTGSMGDELEYLKVELRDIAEEVSRQFPDVDQRWGLVVYRDHHDAYTVRAEDLTDVESMIDALGRQRAGGGGDFPEAMDLALERSEQLSWRSDRNTARMVFLVADAPPHAGGAAERFLDAVRGHRNAGTAIYPVSGSGVDDMAEIAMRVAARATGGQYIYLTDHSGIGGTHKKPHTEETKIESLHDVMLRMIAQELDGTEAPPERQAPPEPVPPRVETSSVEAPPAAVTDVTPSETSFWDELMRRLGEHFLFAIGMSLAVFGAMGIDTFRRRRSGPR